MHPTRKLSKPRKKQASAHPKPKSKCSRQQLLHAAVFDQLLQKFPVAAMKMRQCIDAKTSQEKQTSPQKLPITAMKARPCISAKTSQEKQASPQKLAITAMKEHPCNAAKANQEIQTSPQRTFDLPVVQQIYTQIPTTPLPQANLPQLQRVNLVVPSYQHLPVSQRDNALFDQARRSQYLDTIIDSISTDLVNVCATV